MTASAILKPGTMVEVALNEKDSFSTIMIKPSFATVSAGDSAVTADAPQGGYRRQCDSGDDGGCRHVRL